MLFIIVMEWVINSATEHQERGLSWIKNQKLTDLDFADDIALLGKTKACQQELSG